MHDNQHMVSVTSIQEMSVVRVKCTSRSMQSTEVTDILVGLLIHCIGFS